MLDVLEELELAIGALAEDRSAKWLHYFLDGDVYTGRAGPFAEQTRPKAPGDVSGGGGRGRGEGHGPIPTGWRIDIAGGDLEGGAEDGELDKGHGCDGVVHRRHGLSI